MNRATRLTGSRATGSGNEMPSQKHRYERDANPVVLLIANENASRFDCAGWRRKIARG
jgi:hypothetical protein